MGTRGAQSEGRLALKAHDEEKLERRADRLQTLLLTAAVERYAYALELFLTHGWRSASAAG